MGLRKVETYRHIGEMNSEKEKRANCEIGRRPLFISSVLFFWFNEPSARSFSDWLEIQTLLLDKVLILVIFWGRRKQCKISVLRLYILKIKRF